MGNHLLTWTTVAWLGLMPVASALAQTTYRIGGRATDATTGGAIPFVSVAIKGTPAGTVSDADGRYQLTTTQIGDSLLVSSVGYQTRSFRLLALETQTLDVTLTAAATALREVKVYAKGGDPAYRILREAIRRRNQFDPNRLSAFQYESYSKIEAYLNNFTETKRNGRTGPLARQLSKLPAIIDESGKPAVPIYVSETYSEYYQRSEPAKTKERILRSRARGVGITDGSLTAQLTGASFQQYNFYDNYVSILRKDLPSPLGQAWETLYTFRLIDTVSVGEATCFQIDFEPKRATDLAFTGALWLDTTRYGLSQITARIDQRANINFVKEIRLEQTWVDVGDSAQTQPARLPVLTQLLLDLEPPLPGSTGIFVRFYIAAKNPTVGQRREVRFYEPALELADNYGEDSSQFWQEARPENLSAQELRAFGLVDSVRNAPFLRTVGEIVKLTTVGYYQLKRGPFDIGPLLNSYAFNETEGHRFRFGLRTNPRFDRRLVLSGYAAYGTRDQQAKYGASVDYILQKKPWTMIGFQHSYDIEQLGITTDNIGTNALFAAYVRFGTLRRPYRQQSSYAYIQRELGRGFTQTVGLRSQTFEPLFPFAYRPSDRPDARLISDYRTTELTVETRFAPGERMVQNGNQRYSIGADNRPSMLIRYNLGMRTLHGDFHYHRFTLIAEHSLRLGVLGRTSYQLTAGYMPSKVPYTLLYIPLGNETVFRQDNAYNLMNYFEFATDRYAGLMAEHNFEGLFFNRLPVIRRLKWRFLATGKVLFGSVSNANRTLVPANDEPGQAVLGFQPMGRTPYVEVGYGIDNVFRFFRVDAVHRLTYRSNPGAATFGVRMSARLNL